jgi:hypothetical protein
VSFWVFGDAKLGGVGGEGSGNAVGDSMGTGIDGSSVL